MIHDFLKKAKSGECVYISDVETAFNGLKDSKKYVLIFEFDLMGSEEKRTFHISFPRFDGSDNDVSDFIKSFVWAKAYNILSSVGAKAARVYLDGKEDSLAKLARDLNTVFQIGLKRSERYGYGKAVNVIDRMLGAFDPGAAHFNFALKDISEYKEALAGETPVYSAKEDLLSAIEAVAGKSIYGMDIGGTDIKTVLVIDGEIACLHEYDWFPALFKTTRQLIDPICIIARLMRAKLSLAFFAQDTAKKAAVEDRINTALSEKSDLALITSAVEEAEAFLGSHLRQFDAAGLCFPDVVLRNKIVGGEVYKTRGIRNNAAIDYEDDFSRLTGLDELLRAFMRDGGRVRIINDGPMAAFTAAIESAAGSKFAADGVFAHTLGTELGTGWFNKNGQIPDIPLEVYNFIIDLGSFPERQFASDDVRSINNYNTELPGTLQKYASQSGVFRLAMKYFPQERPDLYRELFERGFVAEKKSNGFTEYVILTEPMDQRKPFLEHMMMLPERENDSVCDRIWREIGEFLAVTFIETRRILAPETDERMLFGRLIKNKRCFLLIKEGAQAVCGAAAFTAANADMANTPLMRQLEAGKRYSVAQFAQAIGAVYYSVFHCGK
jgi:hypothetical protein